MSVRWLRRGVQLAFLVAFVVLLWRTQWPLPEGAPRQLFLRADPLAALSALLSPTPVLARIFLPALIVLATGIIFGRFFCGWICPLGTTIDISDHLFFRQRKQRADLSRPTWKYYLFAATLVAALFGTQLAWLADPLPLLTRTWATVIRPIALVLYNGGVIAGQPVLRAVGLRLVPVEAPVFNLSVLTALIFAGILLLGLISRRYWCRSLCPLGALLALACRFGLIRRQVADTCINCGRCARDCKMGAIDPEQPSRTRTAECILCCDCLDCPPGATHIGPTLAMGDNTAVTSLSRRRALAAMALGAAYGVLVQITPRRRRYDDKLIRPPGAILRRRDGSLRRMTEEEFRDLCVRCGLCMRACPTSAIQPAGMEAGMDGFFTPVLVPRIGWCEQSCNACGQVCPTGALNRFDASEKPNIRVGLATIDQSKCLAWRRGDLYQLCLVCDEHCPYGAIELREYEGQKRPFVNADVCVGCGQCEHVCPVGPAAAITISRRVEGE